MDIGYYLKVNESGNAKITDGTNYKVNDKYVYKGMDVDFRPGFQVSSSYKKYGVYFGYAYGVSDYYRGSLHDHIVTSKLIRFGLTYKLN